ncbi:TPA: hypothetical protein NHR53_006101 [Pseudomonas aeruginosa]|uniref:hypothetical protein n=1 Tax=Pseudomonas aeruginosa TaxID=287 RepID=UPI001111895F|nr:hypothetical protein [Pseudomonas aeruginosa]HCE7248176.1 hypothetical protein [Pseudomonas aeruginosa]HCE8129506.1 hypothetical protein [Pseudomonas aeruginosa]HCF0447618.1 hypothetical protein [Pseudomonas aeruginosa]
MKLLKGFVDTVAKRFGFVRIIEVRNGLDYGYSIAKRLDEHRELAEQIVYRTTLFDEYPWHIGHMATQDDYLMRLYHMVHGRWPEGREVFRELPRSRPKFFGKCCLPEYEGHGEKVLTDTRQRELLNEVRQDLRDLERKLCIRG